MAVNPVGADSAHRNPMRTPNILDLKINGCTPFLSHGDAASERLADAYAILAVMSQAFEGAHEAACLGDKRETIDNMSYNLVARALDGVASLVAYAQHHIDASEKEARS